VYVLLHYSKRTTSRKMMGILNTRKHLLQPLNKGTKRARRVGNHQMGIKRSRNRRKKTNRKAVTRNKKR